MKKILYKLLDISADELRPVLLLLAWSFFSGIFIVSYDIGSNTLFIDAYGQAELPRLFVLSGALGVVFSYIFVSLQKKIPFATLTTYAFIGLLIICVSIGLTLEITKIDALKYLAFAMLGPINAISLLCFYGVISRSFDVRNEKRLTGTVDQGQMFATAIAFFAVYLLPSNMDIVNYIFIGTGALMISLICYLIYIKRFETDLLIEIPSEKIQTSSTSMGFVLKNKYTRLIVLLFLCSVIAIQFVEYTFLSVTYDKYNVNNVFDSSAYADFLAAFGGTLTVFVVLFDVFAADRVIKTVGVRTSLLILPCLLFFFVALSSIIGSYFGHSTLSETFNIYFIFICLGKLLLSSCIESFEDPIIKNFFLPISSSIRHDIQARIEGVFRQLSFTTAGLLMLLFGLMSFELPYYNFILVFVFLAYFYVVWKLYGVYRSTLQETLTAQKNNSFTSFGDYSIVNLLKKELESTQSDQAINALKLIERIEPTILESSMLNLIHDESHHVRMHVLENLESVNSIDIIKKSISQELNPEVKALAMQSLDRLENVESTSTADNAILNLSRSSNVSDRVLAARMLARKIDSKTADVLLFLLKDQNSVVRKSALNTAAKINHPKIWSVFIEHLNSPLYCNYAVAGLCKIGEKVIPILDLAFYKTGQDHRMMIKIIQVLGKIQGDQAIESLWSKIDYPNKEIISEVLLSLSICGFKARQDRTSKITRLLENEITIAAWKLAALIEIKEKEEENLYQALAEEVTHNRHNVFLLLSLMYDASSIRLVKENIESNTVEGVLYAIELLDMFVAEILKPVLFPFLDQISTYEKVELIQEHIPRFPYNEEDVLRKIINKDYNEINRWTKACALYKFSVLPEPRLHDDIVAHLFNPDPLLRQIAAWTIFSIDRNAFRNYVKRIPYAHQMEIESVVVNNTLDIAGYENNMNYEKVLYLKDVFFFKDIPGISQVALVDYIKDEWLKKGDVLIKEGDNGNTPIYIVIHGELVGTNLKNEEIVFNKKCIIGLDLILDTDLNPYTIKATTDTLLYKIEKDRFYDILSRYYEMAEVIIPQLVENVELEYSALV